jgi:hypothetical protein
MGEQVIGFIVGYNDDGRSASKPGEIFEKFKEP